MQFLREAAAQSPQAGASIESQRQLIIIYLLPNAIDTPNRKRRMKIMLKCNSLNVSFKMKNIIKVN